MSGKLAGKNILMVIAPERFRDEELNHPKEIFEKEGGMVKIACKRTGKCTGMFGATATPDMLIKDAKSADYDAVAVVGGMGSPEHLWGDAQLHKLLQEADKAGKVVAAICLSGAVLARAGILKNKEATVFETPESLKELQKGGARFVRKDVVISGKIITANGPEAAKSFGTAIVEGIIKG
ncbi:MAG: DJ-1/PfpI family protein [Nitrospinae bacterium]|nr:DJ-1/PfpI family protein [Nitrospinota bacterium]